ncbi:MAG: hypothetical protein EOM59_01785 [Clostridia bacterium]|nr:hypothetical protein [Clostridia bacterium]
MQKSILTEADLRTALLPVETKEYVVSNNTYVTPSARDYLKERSIVLVRTGEFSSNQTMPWERIEDNGALTYMDALTGEYYSDKPEEMTHLRGNLLVLKTDTRIRFRGKIDSLQARVLELQCVALEERLPAVCDALEEVLQYLRELLAAEVKDVPFEVPILLGMREAELKYVSHHVKEEIGIAHPVPSYRMGRMAMGLNHLRTQVREAELVAVELNNTQRADLIKAMNRLSSAIYIIFCRLLAGNDRGRKND